MGPTGEIKEQSARKEKEGEEEVEECKRMGTVRKE